MSAPLPGTLLLAQDLGLSPTGKRRFSIAGESVDLPISSIADAVVGAYSGLLREHQHHVDLWAWCHRNALEPPEELRPSG